MKKIIFSLIFISTLFFLSCSSTSNLSSSNTAQKSSTTDSNKSNGLFGNIINGVFGSTPINQKDLLGKWNYKGTACEFESENLLKKAGGAIVASQVESKFDEYCKKMHVKEDNTSFVFNSDSTYSARVGLAKVSGKFYYDLKTEKITMTYMFGMGKIQAMVNKSGSNLKLMFDADSMLKMMKFFSKFSNDTSIEVLAKMADMYDGMLLGFDLKKEKN